MTKIPVNVLNVNTTVPANNLSSVKLVYMKIVNLDNHLLVLVSMNTTKILMEIVKSVIVNAKPVKIPAIIAQNVKEEKIGQDNPPNVDVLKNIMH
jgi:hypothetical protein